MKKTECSVRVCPELPKDFLGSITFPSLVTIDDQGNEVPYSGEVILISVKSPREMQYPFSATSVNGVATLSMESNPRFFSNLYSFMYWKAKTPGYNNLFWEIDGELYDLLQVSFSGESCLDETKDIVYEICHEACDTCQEPSC